MLVVQLTEYVMENSGCSLLFDNFDASYRVPMPPGESWIFFFKIPGSGKSWKITLVLESLGNGSLRLWKVLEKLLPPDVIFKAKMHQIRFRQPHTGRAHNTIPDPLAGFKGPYF